MTINRTRTNFTFVTNGNVANKIVKRLNAENRFRILIKQKNRKTLKTEYYIFYYNLK